MNSVVAPWAEEVEHQPHLMYTAADLWHLSNDPLDVNNYELVEGRLVKMSPTGWMHGDLSLKLGAALRIYVVAHRLGKVFGAETGFVLSALGEPDTVLAPDVAFVSTTRFAAALRAEQTSVPKMTGFLRVAPDLVVEIVSPDQYAPEMAAKARRWLAAGVRLVWLVWPLKHTVDVWAADKELGGTTLSLDDSLHGLDVVPGFAYSLVDLFVAD